MKAPLSRRSFLASTFGALLVGSRTDLLLRLAPTLPEGSTELIPLLAEEIPHLSTPRERIECLVRMVQVYRQSGDRHAVLNALDTMRRECLLMKRRFSKIESGLADQMLVRIAEAEQQMDNERGVLECLRCLDAGNGAADVVFQHALLLSRKSDHNRFQDRFQEALTHYSSDDEHRYSHNCFLAAKAAIRSGCQNVADRLIDEILESDWEHADTILRLHEIASPARLAAAVSALENEYRENGESWLGGTLARLLVLSGQKAHSKQMVQSLLKQVPEGAGAADWNWEIVDELISNDFTGPIGDWIKSTELPADFNSHFPGTWIAWCFAVEGDLKSAVDWLNRTNTQLMNDDEYAGYLAALTELIVRNHDMNNRAERDRFLVAFLESDGKIECRGQDHSALASQILEMEASQLLTRSIDCGFDEAVNRLLSRQVERINAFSSRKKRDSELQSVAMSLMHPNWLSQSRKFVDQMVEERNGTRAVLAIEAIKAGDFGMARELATQLPSEEPYAARVFELLWACEGHEMSLAELDARRDSCDDGRIRVFSTLGYLTCFPETEMLQHS